VVASKGDIERLRKSCASLIIVRGTELGKQFIIRRSRLSIGRTARADIVVKDERISREHARIQAVYLSREQRRVYRVFDLDSTNHVYVNGEQVRECTLKNGDKVQLGDTILKFEIQDEIDARFHAEIRHKIDYDALTGLLTYDSFTAALNWELEHSLERKNSCALLMMDLDNFKQVNDTYGHLTGSYVLQEIGGIISENIRQFDVAARYGGEEFVAYLPDTRKEEALIPAERIRALIEGQTFTHNGREVRITISIGVAGFPGDGTVLDPLVRAADQMMYQAKKEGKNRVCVTEDVRCET
ncbi:GGDEF domain-containing protein, partial [Thermodesulfobacteriota bacterium]